MEKKNILDRIKKARLQRFLTNCYSLNVVEQCKRVWDQGDEFVFSYEDHGIDRLAFFAKSWQTLDRLLAEVKEGQYCLEFMTKNPDEYSPEGFVLTAAMKRLANPDCGNVFDAGSSLLLYKDAAIVETAKEQDAGAINGLLWSTFHTQISHLLSEDELREKIKAGQITVHRNEDDHIDALLQAEVLPKKFYINQIVNRGERKVIHAILLDRLEKYTKAGGKYLYAWVEEHNIASLKFHGKYGMNHDGMWNMVYCSKR